MDKIEKYASGNYKDLLDALTDEANRHAKNLETGGVIIRLEAISPEAQLWLGGGQRSFSTITSRKYLNGAETSSLDTAPQHTIDGILSETLSLPERKFYSDELVFSAREYGRSICFAINEHGSNATSLKVVVLVCCDGKHKKEREICFALRPVIKDWCNRENKWLPRLTHRPPRPRKKVA